MRQRKQIINKEQHYWNVKNSKKKQNSKQESKPQKEEKQDD